ncbi:hypothetical protein QBC43DRAFT_354009 [Cladorrhinum sp. PSN259]|nr:hypothetical protein QBC43DRAFT_354009 [Cladorrhinum sp. PSN259]
MQPTNIHTLPGDNILRVIVDHLEDSHVVNLGMTCKRLRELVSYRVFHTIRFSNDARISDSALAAAQKHGTHTKVLHFVGYASEEDDEVGPSEKPTNRDVLPESALRLFEASDGLLPNLETISINFDHYYGESSEHGPHGSSIFAKHESWTDVRAREAKLTMCRLWANTYKALAEINKGKTPNLIIENWSPRGVSTFQTQEWRSYLSNLESFDITIISETFEFGFTNAMQGYVEDVQGMEDFFFPHLDRVRSLKISMLWPIMPFGMRGKYHLPLPLKPTAGHLPALEHLELTNIFISPDLVDFITSHKNLRTVTLHNAHSAAAQYGECASPPHNITWHEFFDALSTALEESSNELGLSILTFTSPAPLSETEAKTGKINYKSESKAVKAVRDGLKAFPGRRLFGYGDMGEQYGDFISDVKTNRESAIAGLDQAAYEKFLGRLAANRERIVGERPAQAREVEVEEREGISVVELGQRFESMEGLGVVGTSEDVGTPLNGEVDVTVNDADRRMEDHAMDLPASTRLKKKSKGPTEQTEPRRSARLANKHAS